jgi:hypothetical protein
MRRQVIEVAVGAAFALLAGALLWPPGAVYWTAVADRIGDVATLVVVATLAAALGAGFARATGIGTRRFAVGSALAYLVGMVGIELARSPDSPVHLLWYGLLAACLVAGGVASTALDGH